MLIEWQRVPRKSAIGWAIAAHVFLIFLLIPAREKGTVHLVPLQLKSVEVTSRKPPLIYRSKTAGVQVTRALPIHRPIHRKTSAPVVPAASAAQTAALNALREQAGKGTRALTHALWFRQIYGFYPGHDYQIAFRTSGEAHISADELPPHFEQFVVVEITIDKDGHVADARRVSGLVPPAIEQKLLSEVREFKYHPATRDGLPVPTQLDVVIHVPS